MTGTILNAVTAAVMAVWPFFVLYAVTNGLMTLLLAGTACVLGVRLALALAGRGETARSGRLLSAAGLVLVGLAALLDEADWMLWYPVLVNASLFSVFGASLFSGMPVVERLARLGLRGKPLPPDPDEPENVAQAAERLGLRDGRLVRLLRRQRQHRRCNDPRGRPDALGPLERGAELRRHRLPHGRRISLQEACQACLKPSALPSQAGSKAALRRPPQSMRTVP